MRLIAGSGRSGTTWVQDALAAANGLRPVFEPLHPYVSEVGKRYGHRALAAGDLHPELVAFWMDACAGRGPRLWTQFRQQWRWLFPPPAQFSTRRHAGRVARHWTKFVAEFPRMALDGLRRDPLVKCIRANLMLPWIARHLDCRIVLIVRHPGAVIESEVRSGWNAGYALERFRSDARLHELTDGRYAGLLARQLTQVEALAARWVIENQWVAEAAAADGISVIHYEELRSPDKGGWDRLCACLGLANRPDDGLLTQPSQQSGAGRANVPLEQSRVPRWMKGLTAEQAGQVQGVLDSVGYGDYVLEDANPRRRCAAGPTPKSGTAHR